MSATAPPHVLSLGSIAADFQVRIDDAQDFGCAMRPASDLLRLSGGKAANVAVLSRRFGCPARLIGRVGSDALAEQALAPLRAEGVDLQYVHAAAGEQTGMALLAVTPDGSKRSIASGEANFGFVEADFARVAAAVEGAPPGSVLAVDYEVTPQAVSRAIALAHSRGLAVVVDPSYPHLVERRDLPGIAMLTPNEHEARALAGAGPDLPLTEVARALAALGPAAVCIKLEGGGCLLMHEGRLWHRKALPAAVVDTSGAGDAFTGAIAVALAEGQDVVQATLMAVAATELSVGVYGSQRSYPQRGQLQERLCMGERPLLAWAE